MKKRIILLIFILIGVLLSSKSQDTNAVIRLLPDVMVKTLENNSVKISDLKNEGNPIILIFWKSCCSPNIKMLDAINEVYEDWRKETGVAVYAISIDDSRTIDKIGPLVDGKAWEFTVLLDVNSDLKRAMNVNATPHVFILNGKKEIVWQKTTYNIGDENELFKIVKSIKK